MFSTTIVVGRLGSDPEIKFTSSGIAVCTVSIAEDRGFGDNKETVWWRCSFWRDKAETVNEHAHKGDVLIVEGRAKASAWLDNSGEPRASLELDVVAWRFGGGGKRETGAETHQNAHQGDVHPF